MDELPEEVLRKLAESMSELNRTMEIHSAILIKTMGNTEDLDEVLKKFGKTVDKVDKIEEELIRKKQYRDAYQESAAREGANALRSFGTALLDSTQGLEKYNATLRSGFDSVADMFMSKGTRVGNALALLTKGVGFAAEHLNEYTSRVIKAYQDLAPLGLASRITSEQITALARDSGFAGDQTKIFTKALMDNKDGLAALGATSSQMITNFGKLTKTTEATRRQLDYIGSSVPEFLNFTAQYTTAQIRSGKIINQNTQTMDQLRDAAFEVYKNFKVVAEVTGISVDQQLENQKKAAANTQYQMYRLVQDDKRLQLMSQYEKTGDIVFKQRADAIQNDLDKRAELAKALPSLLPGQEAGVFESLAQENLNIVMESNKSLYLLTRGDFGKILNDFVKGTTNINEVQAQLAGNVKRTAIELQGLAGLGTSAQPALEAFGLLEGTIPAAMRGISEGAGQSAAEAQASARSAEEAARVELEARLKAAESLTGLATAADSAMALNASMQALERTARDLKDTLASQVNPFVGAFASLGGAIIGIVGQIAIARMILKAGPMGFPTSGGRVALPGDFGVPTSSPGGFAGGAPPGGAPAGGGAGTAGRFAKVGLRGLLKYAPFVGSAYSGYEAYQNFSKGNIGAGSLDALSALVGLVPGLGTGAKLAIQGLATAGSSIAANNAYGKLTDENKEQTPEVPEATTPETQKQDTQNIEDILEKAQVSNLENISEIAEILKNQNDITIQQNLTQNLYDSRAINYYEDIYEELLNQTNELVKLNRYGALQSGLLSGTIKPYMPGMKAGPTATGFLGQDQQEYVRIPYGERYQAPGGQVQVNRPGYAAPVAAAPSAVTTGTAQAPTAAAPGTTAAPPVTDTDLTEVKIPKAGTTSPTANAQSTGSTYPSTSIAQLAAMGLILKPGAQKDNAPLNPKIPELMKILQASVPAFKQFTGINDGYSRTENSKHHTGNAVDFSIQERFLNPKYKDDKNPNGKPEKDFSMAVINAAKAAGFSTVIDEYWKPSSYATAGHFHAQLAEGGRVTGPVPALIGEGNTDELVQPLVDNSILDKLSKTPAADLEIRNEYNVSMQNTMKDMVTSINRLGEKLSNMQQETNSRIETSNSYLRDFLKLRRA